MRFAIKNGGAEQQINAPAALPTNSRVHVAVTLDGQRAACFTRTGCFVATNAALTIRPWQLLAAQQLRRRKASSPPTRCSMVALIPSACSGAR